MTVFISSWIEDGSTPRLALFYPFRVRVFIEHFLHVPAHLNEFFEEVYEKEFGELPSHSSYEWSWTTHENEGGMKLSAPVPKGFKMTTDDKYLVKSFTNGSIPGSLGWRGSDYVSIEAGKFINKQANEGWTLVSLHVPDYKLATVVMERAPRKGLR